MSLMRTMLGIILFYISEALLHCYFFEAYSLVQHGIFSPGNYQGPHSPVKLPPFNKHNQFFNINGSM